jgi:acetylornithine deacetylase/succinyl-diaminopimelate desuccinylase-like protein
MQQVMKVPSGSAYDRALEHMRGTDAQALDDMVNATRIAAPGRGEGPRGEWLRDRLRECGLDTRVDDVGNVIAVSAAADADAPVVVVMAHLDTVFPADTPLDVKRNGTRITGPGISDNARGLAGMLAVARGLAAAGWPNRVPIVFVGSVGEEGAGDLRGAKHFMESYAGRISAFIALDGAGAQRVIHAGVGSRRLRVRFTGPGGHSWSDWGTPNAIHVAGAAIARLTALPLPREPRTTLSVGRMGGGTSVNAIAADAWFELDVRSEAIDALRELEQAVRAALQAATESGGSTRGQLHCDIKVFGDRPAGLTAIDAPLVQLALAATRAIGFEPGLTASSTDANVAMAAGIPAIAIGAGGEAGGTHTTAEWYDNIGGAAGLERALMVVLGAAG